MRLSSVSFRCWSVDVFERLHSGDMIARMSGDTDAMVDLYTHKLRRFVAPFIFSVTSGVAMLALNWRIAVALIAINLVAVYINTRFILPVRRLSDTIQESMATLTEKIIDFLAGFSVVRLFHLYDHMIGLYGATNQRLTSLSIRRYHVEGVLDGVNFFLNMASMLSMIVVGAYLVLLRVTDFGTLLALITLQSRFNQALLQSASYLPQVQKSLAGAQASLNCWICQQNQNAMEPVVTLLPHRNLWFQATLLCNSSKWRFNMKRGTLSCTI